MRNKLLLGIGLFVVSASIALASIKVYFVRAAADGTLIWKSNEAYLFIDVGTRGYALSYLAYPFQLVKEYFGDIGLPTHTHFSVVVIRIGPEIRRWTFPNTSLSLYTPIEGMIYANREGTLWKWSGTDFEPATEIEQRQLEGIRRLSARPINGAQGWFKQVSVLTQSKADARFPLELNGGPETLLVKQYAGGANISISVIRLHGTSQEIWSLDQQAHRVSRAEFQSIFNVR